MQSSSKTQSWPMTAISHFFGREQSSNRRGGADPSARTADEERQEAARAHRQSELKLAEAEERQSSGQLTSFALHSKRMRERDALERAEKFIVSSIVGFPGLGLKSVCASLKGIPRLEGFTEVDSMHTRLH